MKYVLILCLVLGGCTQRHYYKDCNESDMNIVDLSKPVRTSCFKLDGGYVDQSSMKQFHRDVGISTKAVTVKNNTGVYTVKVIK